MTRIGRISSAWSALVQRTAPWIVVVTIAVSVPVLEFAATHLGVYTDTAAMLSDKLPFRQSYERYRRAFPQLTDMILAVIDADTPESADAAGRELAAELEPAGAIFADVFLAGADPFFARNALLYLDEAELDEVGRRLIAAQPLIGQLNGNRTLEGLAEMLRHAVERPPGGPDPGLENLAIELDRSLTALRAESPYTVSWLNALGLDPNGGGATRRYLFLKPILDFREPLAAGAAMRAIRDATDRLDLSGRFGARVRLTGDAALSHDELTTAMRGAQLAGVLALTMVTVVLTVGLRSAWLVIASLVNLLVGLLLTAGFAAAAVGNLNLISLAFAVLYIGLGVDYAIHLSLRYDELLQQGETKRDALRRAAGDVGPSLFLCTLTTATGFFAFWPTSFSGVSELGLISGTGMLINFALSMTLLPALLTLLPAPPVRTRRPADTVGERIAQLARRQRRGIRLAALLMGGAALWMAPQLEFDRNPLNLRPPTSESLATLRELMATSDTPPMHITVLAADETAARRLQGALRGLPSVRDALMLDDLLPAAGAGKRARIDVIDRAIGDSLQAPASPAPTPGAPVAALRDLRDALLAPGRSESLQRLGSSLEDLVPELESAGQREQAVLLRDIEARWLDNFAGTLATLRLALRPGAASIDRIPAQLRERWVASPGPWRIVVYPTDNIDDRAALSTFVREVQTVAPNATDEPVLSLAAGDAVVRAFQQAFSGSLIVISLLLALYLRNLGAALAVLSPLLLAGLVTTAAMVLLGEALNFANVIALPLLFGIGVDNGVHMVHRAHGDPGKPIDPLATSTGRGVLFSTLTTVCGFGNLLFSPHPGTASIGLVLTVGISATIVCTLIVLPALLVLPREK